MIEEKSKLAQEYHSPRVKRLRVFAGPNGSGKTTILHLIDDSFDLGYYINADDIEQSLKHTGYIDLTQYGIQDIDPGLFQAFYSDHSIISKAQRDGYPIDIQLSGNRIINPDQQSHSYEPAFIADFLRHTLLAYGSKLSFESVMSHDSKVEYMRKAKEAGYKVYLYFISTESPDINVIRVAERVSKGGHPVSVDKIKSRYYNSLDLLIDAIQHTYRCYIFDNSESELNMILEINDEGLEYKYEEIPHWVQKYLLDKMP